EGKGESGKLSLKATIAVLACVAVFFGAGLSLFASSNPDGLEWTLFGNQDGGYSANMGLDEEDYGVQSNAADKAAGIQEKLSFLPDYAFKGSDSAIGTSTSGIVGMILVAGVILVVAFVPKLVKKEKVETSDKQGE
ncbi:MAG: PDGLE domain-containing protein, partial [Clostridia bacterium]|nr:PDGLE domain-containing protein [Clostridia bacterium]